MLILQPFYLKKGVFGQVRLQGQFAYKVTFCQPRWGDLIGEFYRTRNFRVERPVGPLRGRAITSESSERTNMLPVHYQRRLSKSLTDLSR